MPCRGESGEHANRTCLAVPPSCQKPLWTQRPNDPRRVKWRKRVMAKRTESDQEEHEVIWASKGGDVLGIVSSRKPDLPCTSLGRDALAANHTIATLGRRGGRDKELWTPWIRPTPRTQCARHMYAYDTSDKGLFSIQRHHTPTTSSEAPARALL
jgi:hypothetical protein